jgi:Trp operon repressor
MEKIVNINSIKEQKREKLLKFVDMLKEEIQNDKNLDSMMIICKDSESEDIITGFCNLSDIGKQELFGVLQSKIISKMNDN